MIELKAVSCSFSDGFGGKGLFTACLLYTSGEYEEEILLHQAAKNAFDEMGVKKLPKVKELQTEYAKLLEEKKKTYVAYRRSREEMRELLTAKANVDRVLKMEVEQDVEKEKDHGQR